MASPTDYMSGRGQYMASPTEYMSGRGRYMPVDAGFIEIESFEIDSHIV